MTLIVVVIAALLAGCDMTSSFWQKEVVNVYTPGIKKEQDKKQLVETLNYWLGRSKADRIRVVGPPFQCTPQRPNEVCEWSAAAAASQRVSMTYDADGIARAWAYQGPYGQFTSDNPGLKR